MTLTTPLHPCRIQASQFSLACLDIISSVVMLAVSIHLVRARGRVLTVTIEPVEVLRGTHKDLTFQFGPLPGFRLDNVVAYEFELPERFEPWPGRTRLERTFVLLDVGVSFANPC